MSGLAASLDLAPAASTACAHCGGALAVGESGRFCCAGCAAAHETIRGLGLGAYYQRRAVDPAIRALRPEGETADYTPFVRAEGGGRHALDLMVDGLHCGACVWLIESVLAREARVTRARVNMTFRRLALAWSGTREDGNRLVDLIARLGYRLVPYDPATLAQADDIENRGLIRALAVAGFAVGNVMLYSIAVWSGGEMGAATRDLLHWVSALVALPAIAYAGLPFFRSAWGALRAGRTNMDVPIAIGVVLASAMSLHEVTRSADHAYFDSAITLLFFLLAGRVLDRKARGRAHAAARHLLALDARAATRIEADGKARGVRPGDLREGDVLLTAAGERFAADGEVIVGVSDIDTGPVSGESVPARAQPGDRVFAGTVNLGAPLRVRVTAVGEATLLAEIRRLMQAAESGRARLVALADRVARYYAPVVHVLALATLLGWLLIADAYWADALKIAVAVLIVTCPCALGLAVPVVQVIASGRLFRRGILVKSATALERLAEVDTIVFDKTGTLTQGRLALAPDPARDPTDLRLAASLAAASRHPLARALAAADPGVTPAAGVIEHHGLGLSLGDIRLGSRAFCGAPEDERVGAELWLARPGHGPVRFAFVDRPRSDSGETIRALAAAGYDLRILSGDRAATVGAVAQELGIAAWRADLLPDAKCRVLSDLAAEGRKVMMVGDGLNDAPALA
ncbi:MAG: copper-translocating P-type ATPase, partial [Alphaproteobacteria bacterium]|nr:copper-translocating P-type ATPase [Alphaproteobacteria bacterium]